LKASPPLTTAHSIVTGFQHVLVTRGFFECCIVSLKSREKTTGFPLWVAQSELLQAGKKSANIRDTDLRWLVSAINGRFQNLDDVAVVIAAFHVVYAQLHSPGYRSRYSDFLQRGFPRIFSPVSHELFTRLAKLGGELIALHLMESSKLDHYITTYTGPKDPEVRRVGWSDDTVWLDAAATKKGRPASPGTIGFRGVPEAVWNFHIGGYQVCEKWLKDRKGRTLSDDDIAHYQKIVVALAQTIRLMQEIDEVIEQHGGWPDAFVQRDIEANAAEEADNVVPLPRPQSLAFAEPVAPLLRQAAEPEASPYEPANPNPRTR
jgi:uncharacterized protein